MRWAFWALMMMTTACVTAPKGGSQQACADGTRAVDVDDPAWEGEPDPEPGEPEPAILDRQRGCVESAATAQLDR